MRFFCPGCGTKYNKPESEIPEGGTRVVCDKCGFKISVKQPRSRQKPARVAKPKEKVDPETEPPTVAHDSRGDPTERVIRAEPPPKGQVPRPPDDLEETEEIAEEEQIMKPKKPRPRGKSVAPGKILRYVDSLGTGKSGKTFRFRDLFYALLVPLDYRKLVACLEQWSDLRAALELTRVPHYSTLCYAADRLLKKGAPGASLMRRLISPRNSD